jgi:hypothetical protein
MEASMKEFGDKPRFTFTSEVMSYKLDSLHDSLFAPPRNYKRTK